MKRCLYFSAEGAVVAECYMDSSEDLFRFEYIVWPFCPRVSAYPQLCDVAVPLIFSEL